jgi:hypothetical protein
MTAADNPAPVHESLEIIAQEDIYRNQEWWKSVVKYQHEEAESTETAIYLWHKEDDGWTRKNKYVIKTAEAWADDREVIESFLDADTYTTPETEFPVSDYYNVAAGVTVFESDGWWKAIINIDQKGSYDTDEIMVYLWQQRDDDWRRRQKYTIKDRESWEAERVAVESVLDGTDNEQPITQTVDDTETDSDEVTTTLDVSDEVADLDRELDAHLSETLE